jgi:hypothetical protein
MSAERRVLGLVLTGFLIILGTALSSWFLTHFERMTETIPVGYSAAARRNDLLAAERFLSRLGVQVQSVAGRNLLRQLPSTKDTLVIPGLGALGTDHRAELRSWLEGGGHLVLEAMQVWDEEEPSEDFLTELGIRLRAEDQDQRGQEVEARYLEVDLQRPLSLEFRTDYYLEIDSVSTGDVVAGGRLHLTRRSVGAGLLTVVSDSRFMDNRNIGDKDHALAFARLVAPASGGKVWLLYDSRMPWLGALIWSVAPQASVAVAALLAIWVWWLGARLGPLAAPPERRRRNLIEHLDASADFQWRHGRALHLVTTSRRRILSAWLRRHPGLEHAGRHQQILAAAEATGQPVDVMTRALFAQTDAATAFVEQGSVLQCLWRKAIGGNGFRHRIGRRHPSPTQGSASAH